MLLAEKGRGGGEKEERQRGKEEGCVRSADDGEKRKERSD